MAATLALRVETEGFDPIELTIARGIVKAMGEDGLNPEKAAQVGACVAEAIGSYQRTKAVMAAPVVPKPRLFNDRLTADQVREAETPKVYPKP